MTKLLKSIVGSPIIKSLYNEEEIEYNKYFLAGSRTSGKTYTACELIVILSNFITKSNKELKVDTYYFRNHKTFALESWFEFNKNWKNKFNSIIENKKEMSYTNDTGNEIKFLGANIMSNIGKESANSGLSMKQDRDLILVIVEEAQQIDLEQLENAFLSLRSNANTKLLFLFLMNPTNSTSKTVKKAIEICKPSLPMLMNKGYCFNTKTETRWLGNEKLVSKSLCLWNNFMTCKDDLGNWLVSKDVRIELADKAKNNPEKAVCDVWGFPYSVGGFVYKNLHNAVITPYKAQYERITAGIDVAGGKSKDSAINTCVVVGWLDDYHCEVIATYIFNQKEEVNAVISDKAKYFLNCLDTLLEQYEEINKSTYEIECDVRVDYGGGIGGDMIAEFEKWNSNNNISFQPCVKKCAGSNVSDIANRIEIENDCFKNGKIKIHSTCSPLIEQLENIEWVKGRDKETMVRSDKDNDLIDAFEYAICYEYSDLRSN